MKHRSPRVRAEWPRCASCRQLLPRDQAEAAGYKVEPAFIDVVKAYTLEKQYRIKRMNGGFV